MRGRNQMVYSKMTGKFIIEIGSGLYQFVLPEPLYTMYLETITSIETGSVDTETGDLARRSLHEQLVRWWQDKMPHVGTDIFDKSLVYAVEHDLPFVRRIHKYNV